MQLRTSNGNLTLGSVYKLFVWSWLLAWGAMIGAALVVVVIVTLVNGQTVVNGEVIHGRAAALLALAPFMIMLPIVIALHAFMFSGLLTFGAWLYRLRRPLAVTPERDQPPAQSAT